MSVPTPTTFFEYDPSSNSVTRIVSPANAGGPCYNGRMLLLPSGQYSLRMLRLMSKSIRQMAPSSNVETADHQRPTRISANKLMCCGASAQTASPRLSAMAMTLRWATNYPLVWCGTGQLSFSLCRTFDILRE